MVSIFEKWKTMALCLISSKFGKISYYFVSMIKNSCLKSVKNKFFTENENLVVTKFHPLTRKSMHFILLGSKLINCIVFSETNYWFHPSNTSCKPITGYWLTPLIASELVCLGRCLSCRNAQIAEKWHEKKLCVLGS